MKIFMEWWQVVIVVGVLVYWAVDAMNRIRHIESMLEELTSRDEISTFPDDE